MTKAVRIENADTSHHPVRVTVQIKRDGEWVNSDEKPVQIDNPTAMTTAYIWAEKRLIIEEMPADANA